MMTECYCVALRVAARKVSSIYDEALAPAGVSVAQYSLLRRIGHFQPVSLTELARLSLLDRSTVGRNAKLLERDGLIRSVAGRDQRETALELTEAAQQVLSDGAPLWNKAQAEVEALLGEEGARNLRALLHDL